MLGVYDEVLCFHLLLWLFIESGGVRWWCVSWMDGYPGGAWCIKDGQPDRTPVKSVAMGVCGLRIGREDESRKLNK